jgi:hypothetical protein
MKSMEGGCRVKSVKFDPELNARPYREAALEGGSPAASDRVGNKEIATLLPKKRFVTWILR